MGNLPGQDHGRSDSTAIEQETNPRGALGRKLCGAGGGRFLLFVVPEPAQDAVRNALSALREVPVGPRAHGSQILFVE